MANQLLIKNGRVIDPANRLDKKCDVLIADGKVAEVGNLNGGRREDGRAGHRRHGQAGHARA